MMMVRQSRHHIGYNYYGGQCAYRPQHSTHLSAHDCLERGQARAGASNDCSLRRFTVRPRQAPTLPNFWVFRNCRLAVGLWRQGWQHPGKRGAADGAQGHMWGQRSARGGIAGASARSAA
jgi:hypothetical protein